MPAASVTLVYLLKPTAVLTAAQLATLAGGITLPSWIPIVTGAALTGIAHDTDGSGYARVTVVYDVTSAKFQTRFGANPTAPFFGLLTGIIRAACNQPPLEQLPVAA